MSAFSIRSQTSERRIVKIPMNEVFPGAHQPRKQFDGQTIAALAQSIREVGLLSPILVRRCPEGFELIAGERRFRAMELLKFRECEAIVLGGGDCDCALIGLIENLQREELHYLDAAMACRRILSRHGLTQEALAAAIGKSPSALANQLRLLRLDEQLRTRLREYRLSERHARALLKLADPAKQSEMAETAFREQLSVRQLEERIARMSRKKAPQRLPDALLKENRLVVNAVNETVRQLRRIGVRASSRVESREDSFDVIITVRTKSEAPAE